MTRNPLGLLLLILLFSSCASVSFLAFAGCSVPSSRKAVVKNMQDIIKSEHIDFLLNVGVDYYIQQDPSFYEIIDDSGVVDWEAYWLAMAAGNFHRKFHMRAVTCKTRCVMSLPSVQVFQD